MSWREALRPASFRGVPFYVEDADQQGGRRQAVHEFPQRDDVYVEDLGLRPHEFRIDGYVLGADYMAGRDALIAAADAPGTGTLVHPYRGSLTVSCMSWTTRESARDGGIAWVTLIFIASAAAQPTSVEDTGALVEDAAAVAEAEGTDGLVDQFSVEGQAGFVAESAAGRVQGLVDRLDPALTRLGAGRDALSGVTLRLATLRQEALQMVRRVPDLAGAVAGLVTSARLLANTPRAALRELRGLIGLNTGARTPGDTPARIVERANVDALERLVTLVAAAEAGRAVAAMPFASYDEAVAVRDDLADRLDSAAQAAADAGDDGAFRALSALRLAVTRDVTRRGGSLARIYSYTPPATEPALVTAHRLYGQAGRADEIVERNRVPHPGFVPGAEPLEVLTDG